MAQTLERLRDEEILGALGDWSARRGPLYQRLAEALREAIDRADIPGGSRLPPERSLARMLSVSRSTVVGAYQALAEGGTVEARVGSGTWVRVAAGAMRPAVREPMRSAGFFRGLLEDRDGIVDMTLACLPGLEGLPSEGPLVTLDDLAALAPARGYSPLGIAPLRAALAARYTAAGLPTDPEQILVTTGGQQGLALAAGLFARRGEPAVLESPAYPGLLDVLERSGARLLPVETGRDGADIAAIEAAVATAAPSMIVVVPTFQNPTGGTMPTAARRRLAAIASEAGVPVVEDNVLGEIALTDDPVPPLVASFADGDAPVLTIDSLSKLFWPGLRIGWIRGPATLIARLGRLKIAADLGSSVLSQALACRLLERIDEQRAFRRRQLEPRLDLLCALLAERLPKWRFERPAGGLTLWVRLPCGNADEFAQVALRHGVAVVPGSTMSPDDRHLDWIRMSFVADEDVLHEGVERLVRAWDAYECAPDRGCEPAGVVV